LANHCTVNQVIATRLANRGDHGAGAPESMIFDEAGAGRGVGIIIRNRSWSRSEIFSLYRSRI